MKPFLCSISGCDRPAKSRGMCQKHYVAARRRGEVLPPGHRRPRSPEGMYWCGTCKQHFPLEQFNRLRSSPSGVGGPCRACREVKYRSAEAVARRKRYYAENRDSRRTHKEDWYRSHPEAWRRHRLARFGITPEEFDARFDAQDQRCAICHADRPQFSPGGGWHLDHDHSCCPGKKACGQCIRGILCSRCNRAIGMFNDDAKLLAAAVEYLLKSGEIGLELGDV